MASTVDMETGRIQVSPGKAMASVFAVVVVTVTVMLWFAQSARVTDVERLREQIIEQRLRMAVVEGKLDSLQSTNARILNILEGRKDNPP